MTLLILGLALFLATHSVRIFAEDWRTRQIARFGAMAWKGGYSLLSLIGLIVLVWGFGLMRADPVILYLPPPWLKHVTILLTLPAFILFAAADGPANIFKQTLGHPMVVGVKLWAFAHLLSNGRARDLLLFGGLLIWAIIDYAAARRRDRLAGVEPVRATGRGTLATVAIGVIGWAVFALFLHRWLIGIDPLAG